LFLGIGLGALGLLLFLARDLAPVTGILAPELAGALGIVFLVLGVAAAVAEVGLVLERDGRPGRVRRRGRGAVAPVPVPVATVGVDEEGRVDPPADVAGAAMPTGHPEDALVKGAAEKGAADEAVTADDAGQPVAADPAGPQLEALGYAALTVRDRDRSVGWYSMVLGFVEVSRQDGDARRSSVMRFGSGGFSVGLVERQTTGDLVSDRTMPGLDHLAFAVGSREDLVAWDTRLSEAGVAHSAVTDIPPGAILYLADPDGITLALFWQRPPT
jgi:catechol 2,3-dioxygenase-like lactoylglutathione lyase family enzyme